MKESYLVTIYNFYTSPEELREIADDMEAGGKRFFYKVYGKRSQQLCIYPDPSLFSDSKTVAEQEPTTQPTTKDTHA